MSRFGLIGNVRTNNFGERSMSKSVEIYNNDKVKAIAIVEHDYRRNVDGVVYKVIAGNQITNIDFQDGSLDLNGINGLNIASLLEICLDRFNFLTENKVTEDTALIDSNLRSALSVLDRIRIE